jgi:acetolactate synthase-1/2/3 large subunit
MNIDHQKLFAPITKATFRINPSNVAEVIDKALKLSVDSYPGPIHIGLPSGIAKMEVDEFTFPAFRSESQTIRNNFLNIKSLLQQSRRPLMAVGLTAARLGISSELARFLNEYKMPVVITPMAKGIIQEDHPCYAGVLFHALSDYLEDIYEKCDLVIGIGYDPVEYNYESWMPDVPLVHFDIKETDMPPDKIIGQFTGLPEDWFKMLGSLDAGSLLFDKHLIEGVRNEMASVFEGFTNHFGPVSALKILQDELPSNAIVTADVGSHLHLFGQFWKTNSVGKTIISNGWSGMGFGLPAALAAQLNNREGTVVCITGDGGFLMMAGEMITARRYNLPVIVVVLSDGELNLIKLKQSWKDQAPYGTILYQGDLFGADRFFGIRVLTADSNETMRTAVNEALFLNEPVIINAVIDPEDYKWLVVKR